MSRESLGRLVAFGAVILLLALTGCNDDDSGTTALGSSDDSSSTVGNGDNGGDGAGPPPSAPPPMLCAADAPSQSASETEDAVAHSTGADGQTIDVHMSIFRPALAKGECAPVIIKSHGFGGSRLTSLSDVSDDDNATNVATRDAWRSGYFVVTFDQRGFGQTGGKVRVEDPDYEGQDIKAVLDYAQANLGDHLAYRDGDPVVGALGLSYGGGFQLIGAGVDPRFDAIVPAATWYALPYSLDPNGVPKTVWLDLLTLLGTTGAKGQLAPFIYQGFLQAQTLGVVSDDIVEELRGNGLNAFCEGLRPDGAGPPRVDAFLVQGVNDTLFNMNEAVANAACLRQAGNDVRVLIQRTGHILPLFQDVMNAFGFDLDPTVTCNGVTYDTSERMLTFLDDKLRGISEKRPVDKNCIVQDDTHGITPAEFPVGGQSYTIASRRLTTGPVVETVSSVLRGLSLNGDLLPTIADSLRMTVGNLLGTLKDLTQHPADVSGLLTNDVLKLLPPELLKRLTSPAREITLFTASAPMTLAGVPTADLTIKGPPNAAPPIAFVGLGVRRAGEQKVQLLNDQIAPLKGRGEHDQQLVGVSTRLAPGDSVYLMVYGFHYQYYASFNRIPQAISISGDVSLPLTDD